VAGHAGLKPDVYKNRNKNRDKARKELRNKCRIRGRD
jgi:hypothetical protein